MNTHLRLIAILHIILGALGLVAAAIIFSIFGAAGGLVIWNGELAPAAIIGTVGLFIGGFIALKSIPDMIAGWAMLANKAWARPLMIVVGVLDLFHFPIGTAIGIYTLWILLRDEFGKRSAEPSPSFDGVS